MSETNFKFFVQSNSWTSVFCLFIAVILGVFTGEVRNKASRTGPRALMKCLRLCIHTNPKSYASPSPVPCFGNVSAMRDRSGDQRQSLFQRRLTQGSVALPVCILEANSPRYQAEPINVHFIVTIAL